MNYIYYLTLHFIIIVRTEAGLYGLYFHTVVKHNMCITIDKKFKQLQYCGFRYQLCWHDNNSTAWCSKNLSSRFL